MIIGYCFIATTFASGTLVRIRRLVGKNREEAITWRGDVAVYGPFLGLLRAMAALCGYRGADQGFNVLATRKPRTLSRLVEGSQSLRRSAERRY